MSEVDGWANLIEQGVKQTASQTYIGRSDADRRTRLNPYRVNLDRMLASTGQSSGAPDIDPGRRSALTDPRDHRHPIPMQCRRADSLA